MHEFRTNNIAIFFDYLQKIPLGRQYEDIRGQVNEASAQLADISLELECPVFAISAMDKEGCKLDENPPLTTNSPPPCMPDPPCITV